MVANDNTAEFVCEDCGIDVIQFGYHDGLNVCQVCRWIRSVPDMPEEMKAHLRGDSTEEVVVSGAGEPNIDTSDIPEANEEWFKHAKLVPKKDNP